jgi:hypothetical protein
VLGCWSEGGGVVVSGGGVVVSDGGAVVSSGGGVGDGCVVAPGLVVSAGGVEVSCGWFLLQPAIKTAAANSANKTRMNVSSFSLR